MQIKLDRSVVTKQNNLNTAKKIKGANE